MSQICDIYTKSQWLEKVMHGDKYVDQATGEALYRHYAFWEPCTDDLTQWETWVEDALYTYSTQYINLVRIQTTEIDPLVSEYMERQIKRYGTAASIASDSSSRDTHSKDTRTDTPDAVTTTTHKYDHTTLTKVEHDTTDTASSKDSHNTIDKPLLSDTTTYDADRTTSHYGATSATDDQTRPGQETSRQRGISGQLPQTTQYAADAGMPADLNWHYATAQQEGDTSTHRDGGTTTHTAAEHDDWQEHTGGTTVTHTGSKDTTSTGETNGTTRRTGTDTTTATAKTNATDGDTDTTHTTGKTSNVEGESTATEKGTGRHTADTITNGEDREIYSGRHASPQDMLDAARKYVEHTNAFMWLCRQMDACFYLPYDIQLSYRYGGII